MSSSSKLKNKKIPQHVAIIMDGNGRWAKILGKERSFGHQKGIDSVKHSLEASLELNIKYLTLFAFSKENWERPSLEIKIIMELLTKSIIKHKKKLIENNVKLNIIGDLNDLPDKSREAIKKAIKETNNNNKITLTIALSYSSRWEITNSIKKICNDIITSKIKLNKLTEDVVNNYLCTNNLPYPDLLIRTGGEKRISNFLLWQLAYAELYFTKTNWPDFNKRNFYNAIFEYQKRERRFGKVN
tara:strand:- start:256 stop:984 length:729 start_codon:yes stop_codon:yes gene_type:complete